MLLLTTTGSVVRILTGSAAAVSAHASYMDNNAGTVTPGYANTASITTAATTTVVAAPGSSIQRNVKLLDIRNTHASASTTVEVQQYDATTAESLIFATLLAGEALILDELGCWTHYDVNGSPYVIGLPFTTLGDLLTYGTSPQRLAVGSNRQVLTADSTSSPGVKWAYPEASTISTSTVSAAFASDTYLAGSAVPMPAAGPIAGTIYRCKFDMVKTAAGTAAFTINVRYGVNGSTADASLLSFAFTAGSGVADTGMFEIDLHFRTVGSGTAAVVVATAKVDHQLAATGLTTQGAAGYAQITTVSSGFNSTPAGSILGISVNGGASFSGTNAIVQTDCTNLS